MNGTQMLLIDQRKLIYICNGLNSFFNMLEQYQKCGKMKFWEDSWTWGSSLFCLFKICMVSVPIKASLITCETIPSSYWDISIGRNFNECELSEFVDLLALLHKVKLNMDFSRIKAYERDILQGSFLVNHSLIFLWRVFYPPSMIWKFGILSKV